MPMRIRIYGDPVLRRKADAIVEVDDEIRRLAREMIQSMYAESGIGLAAPQVGSSLRLIVADPLIEGKQGNPRAFINPEIVDSWGACTYEEGCLSLPGVNGDVDRPEGVTLRFLDHDGAEHEESFDGLWARVLQHEIDHLNGKLFVDHLSTMRRAMLQKRLKELVRESREQVQS